MTNFLPVAISDIFVETVLKKVVGYIDVEVVIAIEVCHAKAEGGMSVTSEWIASGDKATSLVEQQDVRREAGAMFWQIGAPLTEVEIEITVCIHVASDGCIRIVSYAREAGLNACGLEDKVPIVAIEDNVTAGDAEQNIQILVIVVVKEQRESSVILRAPWRLGGKLEAAIPEPAVDTR